MPTKKKTAKKTAVKKSSNTKKTVKKNTKGKSKTQAKSKKAQSKTKTKTKKTKSSSKTELLEIYKQVKLARLIDEKIIVLYKQNKCHFQIGCSGHELPGVIAARTFKSAKDWFYPYYRDLALCLALGMSTKELFLNALNKEDCPNSHGRQMPAHFGHKDLNIVSQSSPTGSQFLQAVGVALSIKKKGEDNVVYVSAGEGTCSQGDFHEALNWASRDKLPIIFMIQNNGYAISVPIKEQIAGESVSGMVKGYDGLKVIDVDGTDVYATEKAVQEAYKYAKQKGAVLIEAHVPRLLSHSISDNHLKYREEKAIKADSKRCPLDKLEKEILKKKVISKKELDELKVELKKQVDAFSEEAELEKDPSPDTASNFVYAENFKNQIDNETDLEVGGEDDLYMVDALNLALKEELEFNPDMYIFGEDVAGGKGGVFSVTQNLSAEFGMDRVFNSQLAESSIVGAAIGMATYGLKPVVEIQFGDYIWTAMNQIRNEMAMMYYRSGGDFECGAVVRVAVGGYIRGACYHSQNIEATFAHFPGLVVAYPSNAKDAKGMLKSAIRSRNPVLFLEHKGLYRQVYAKGPKEDQDAFTPLGKAKVVKEGSDLTIVTYGALVQKSLLVAKELEKEGATVEVIDVRTILPLDKETVFDSVRKTNRVLIAHEDVEFMGFGAELAALIADNCFNSLDAPIKRVGMKNVSAVPHAPKLEEEILPQVWDILTASRSLLVY